MREQNLEKLAAAVRSGKYRIADLPGELIAQGGDVPLRRKPKPLQI